MAKKQQQLMKSFFQIFSVGLVLFFFNYKTLTSTVEQSANPITNETNNDKAIRAELENLNRRKFVSYTSSQWELLWLANIPRWEKNKVICKKVLSHKAQVQEFMRATCTLSLPSTDWCLHNDTYQPYWIHTKNIKVSMTMPEEVSDLLYGILSSTNSSSANIDIAVIQNPTRFELQSKPFQFHDLPEDEHGSPVIFSKFTFLDEVTNQTFVEYIEPLVSHLRHPLALCINRNLFLRTRSYLIPPPHVPQNKKHFYFDAGASTWLQGAGGPSLSYFTPVWLRHGIDFHHIQAWEGSTPKETFYKSVPNHYQNRTFFAQQWVAKSVQDQSENSPFIPSLIRNITKIDDYVLFKLDIDNGEVEMGIVNHLLSNQTDDLQYIDEFAFEHHVEGNYLLKPHWKKTVTKGASLLDSYNLFLDFRRKGVRAHSWV